MEGHNVIGHEFEGSAACEDDDARPQDIHMRDARRTRTEHTDDDADNACGEQQVENEQGLREIGNAEHMQGAGRKYEQQIRGQADGEAAVGQQQPALYKAQREDRQEKKDKKSIPLMRTRSFIKS